MGMTTRSPQLVGLRLRFARSRLHTLAIMGLASSACTDAPDDVEYGETVSALSVGSYVTSSCSTSVVRGLSMQIAREVDCMSPSSLAQLAPSEKVRFSSNAVLPFMHPGAKGDLLRVTGVLQVNSAYRTVAQQYLLYRWWQAGRCGISAAATPGRSNHESGRAVDLQNWSARRASMAAHHWAHSVPGDPVHFDHTQSPDNRGKDVRAFQRLWNRNHPGDKRTVDGIYGTQTANRLKASPAKGFAKGACNPAGLGAEVVAIDGPDRIAPASLALYSYSVTNTDVVEWPAGARVVVAGGVASTLASPNWVSPTEVGPLGTAIAPGAEATIDIEVLAPTVVEETSAATTFAIVDGDRQLGTFDLALSVTPNGDEYTSSDAHDDVEDDGTVADEDGVVIEDGGCSTGGSLGWLALVIPALLVNRRRRATIEVNDRTNGP